jgi:hypothetical protein
MPPGWAGRNGERNRPISERQRNIIRARSAARDQQLVRAIEPVEFTRDGDPARRRQIQGGCETRTEEVAGNIARRDADADQGSRTGNFGHTHYGRLWVNVSDGHQGVMDVAVRVASARGYMGPDDDLIDTIVAD